MIVKCPECGTVQYIKKGQQTRTCPRCQTRIKCKDLKIFEKASTINEALQIVRLMKTPNEISKRMATITALSKNQKRNELESLGILISELLEIFPNAMPEEILYEKAVDLELNSDFVKTTLGKLHQEGLMLITPDRANNRQGNVLKFPSVPFTYGKMHVAKPSR